MMGCSRGNFPILSRDPDLSRKPPKNQVGNGDRFVKRRMAEKNGWKIPPDLL